MTLLRWPTAAELGAQWLSIKIFQKVILPQLMAATIEHLLMNRGRTTKTKVWVEISEYKMCLIWDCKTCDESIWNLSFMFDIETKAFSWIRSLDLSCSIFHRCKHRYTATFEKQWWKSWSPNSGLSHARCFRHEFLWVQILLDIRSESPENPPRKLAQHSNLHLQLIVVWG